MPHYTYVAFDPGETVGVCCFNEKAEHIYANNLSKQGLADFLLELESDPPELFIIEDYVIYGQKAKAHIGSRVPTVLCIGGLDQFAQRYKIPVVKQLATVMTMAELWSGKKRPKNHKVGHYMCAYLHGYYYLFRKGLIKQRVLEDYT